MLNFLFKTIFYTVICVLLLIGGHTLHVRYRDRNFSIEEESRIARHYAEKSSAWVKDLLHEQRLALAERAEHDTPAIATETDNRPPQPSVDAASSIARPNTQIDSRVRNKRTRRIFRSTVRSLSDTETILTTEDNT